VRVHQRGTGEKGNTENEEIREVPGQNDHELGKGQYFVFVLYTS
jgi:hypothetical protein